MTELGQVEQPLTADQIIAQHSPALDQVVKAAQEPEYEFERLAQINKARRNWQMVRGNHFLTPGIVSTPYGEAIDYIPWDGGSDADETGADVRFARPVNVIGGDCTKFVAVMGNTAPRVKAIADDPEDAQSIEDAKNADAVLRDLWVKWKSDQKQRVLAFHQYTTGPIFLRTKWVMDGQKYGQTTEPKIEVVPDAAGNLVPQQTGVQTYENGDVELELRTVLEVAVPYMAQDLEQCGYLKCEVMRSKWDLLDAYPEKLAKYRNEELPDGDDGNSSSNAAAEARESVSSPSGMGRARKANHWRFTEIWVQPYLYQAIEDEDARKVLMQQYPAGLYVARVGGVTVDIDNRRLTDEWAVCKTGRGEKILEDPIASDAVPYQQTINDLFGIMLETILRAIAQTIVDSQLIDREAMAKKEALPAEIILTQMPTDGDLTKRVVQIPPARVSDQTVPFANLVRQYWQDNTGIRPELSGGGAPTQTYREAKQRKDQALMQLSPQAQDLQFAWCRAAENGIRMRAKYGVGTIKAPRKGAFGLESDVVDLARLSESGWHVEADDNFPMNVSDRRDAVWGLLKEFPPEIQQILGVTDALNLEELLEILQLPGFHSVQADQKRKTLADIAQLLQGQPIEDAPEPDGQPGQKQPSIPADAYDDHAFVADFTRKWMVSATGQSWKQQSPEGFENVALWQQAHQQAAQPPQQPQIKASVSLATTPQDIGPDATSQMLQNAGIQAQPQQIPPPAPQKSAGAQPEEQQESPLPPPEQGPPEGPQAIQ